MQLKNHLWEKYDNQSRKSANFTEILTKWLNIYITNHIKKRKKTYLKILPEKKLHFSTTSGEKNVKFDDFL